MTKKSRKQTEIPYKMKHQISHSGMLLSKQCFKCFEKRDGKNTSRYLTFLLLHMEIIKKK